MMFAVQHSELAALAVEGTADTIRFTGLDFFDFFYLKLRFEMNNNPVSVAAAVYQHIGAVVFAHPENAGDYLFISAIVNIFCFINQLGKGSFVL